MIVLFVFQLRETPLDVDRSYGAEVKPAPMDEIVRWMFPRTDSREVFRHRSETRTAVVLNLFPPWNPQGFRRNSRGTLRIVFNFFFPANLLKIHEHIFVIRWTGRENTVTVAMGDFLEDVASNTRVPTNLSKGITL